MSAQPTDILLRDAGLSDAGDDIIAHGFLDLENIGKLMIDDYQREVLSSLRKRGKAAGIPGALNAGRRLPSIVIGMRGSNFTSKGDHVTLHDRCYIIDGLQRISGIKTFAEEHPDKADNLLIGAEVRFSTTKEAEKDLFHALNSYRTAMSPNVLLRNMRDKNRAILTVYGLSMSDKDSPLYKKVQWGQRMARGELLTATTLVNVSRILHGRASQSSGGAHVSSNAQTLERLADHVGLNTFRQNLRAFIDLLDECFLISKVQYTKQATPLKGSFLAVVAQMLTEHEEFWDGNLLSLDASQKRKLANFPIDDYEVARLAGAGSGARPILYEILKTHMNKGRRTGNKLEVRVKSTPKPFRPRKG